MPVNTPLMKIYFLGHPRLVLCDEKIPDNKLRDQFYAYLFCLCFMVKGDESIDQNRFAELMVNRESDLSHEKTKLRQFRNEFGKLQNENAGKEILEIEQVDRSQTRLHRLNMDYVWTDVDEFFEKTKNLEIQSIEELDCLTQNTKLFQDGYPELISKSPFYQYQKEMQKRIDSHVEHIREICIYKYRKQGDYHEAITYAEKWLGKSPDNPKPKSILLELYESLTRDYQAKGDDREAIAYAEKWLGKSPDDPRPDLLLLKLFKDKDDKSELIRHYQQHNNLLGGLSDKFVNTPEGKRLEQHRKRRSRLYHEYLKQLNDLSFEERQVNVADEFRRNALYKVRKNWIEDGLYTHLNNEYDPFIIPLKSYGTIRDSDQTIPSDDIDLVFGKSNGKLLIVGNPGSGKTITLLQLLEALILKAQDNGPLPFVFPLSSWARKPEPLEDWLKKELQQKYRIQSDIAEDLVDDYRIIPLLDGLDEVVEDVQLRCVKAIQVYMETHSEVVICCRSETESQKQLIDELSDSKIMIFEMQPLSSQQVDNALASTHYNAIRTLLENPLVQNMMQAPFYLNTIRYAFAGELTDSLPEIVINATNEIEVSHAVCDSFVLRRMRAASQEYINDNQSIPFKQAQLRFYLGKLACDQDVIFRIEYLQKEWLISSQNREIYMFISRFGPLIFAAPYGVGMAYILAMLVIYHGNDLNLIVPIAISSFLLTVILVWLIWYIFEGRTHHQHIEPSEEYEQSWKHIKWNIVLPSGFIAVMGGVLLDDIVLAGIASMTIIAMLAWLSSYKNKEITVKEMPNEGMFTTLQNAKRALYMQLIGFMVIFGLLGTWLARTDTIVFTDVIILVMSMGSIIFLMVSGNSENMRNGTMAIIQHSTLRYLLNKEKVLPLNIRAFADYAVELRILNRVGGGYRFSHDIMKDFFASKEELIHTAEDES